MPDQGQGVPEDEGGVPPGLTRVHLIGAIVVISSNFHELGNIEDEGEEGDGDDDAEDMSEDDAEDMSENDDDGASSILTSLRL